MKTNENKQDFIKLYNKGTEHGFVKSFHLEIYMRKVSRPFEIAIPFFSSCNHNLANSYCETHEKVLPLQRKSNKKHIKSLNITLMDTSMLIYPLLVFVIGFAAMIYMKTKGRNTKGNYVVAGRQYIKKFYPNLDVQQYEIVEGKITYSITAVHIPVLIAYNPSELYLFPVVRNMTGTKLNTPEGLEEHNEHIPVLSIQQIGITEKGDKMAFVVRGKETVINFSKRNSFNEDQSEEVSNFLTTMAQAADN